MGNKTLKSFKNYSVKLKYNYFSRWKKSSEIISNYFSDTERVGEYS